MFCCSAKSLYYTSFLEEDSSQIFIDQQTTLKQKLSLYKNQSILPLSFSLSSQNILAIETDQNLISQSDYCVKSHEQTKVIEIKQMKKQNMETLWKVMKQNEKDQIYEDDVFGFGPYNFKVYHIGKRNQSQFKTKQYETQMRCRICFTDQTSEKNPLMNFCQCTGSIKYMHLHCLREWIKEGAVRNEFQKWSYVQYSKLTCNVCKKLWLQKVKHNKKCYYLYQPQQKQERPKEGTKILLAMPTFAEENDKQSLLVVKFYLSKTSSFLIGSNQDECDLILDNLNVSMIQCELTLQNQKLILKDMNSYHGTGIKIQSNHELSFSSKTGILLRYNGVFMHFKAKDSFFSCLDPEETYKIQYSYCSL